MTSVNFVVGIYGPASCIFRPLRPKPISEIINKSTVLTNTADRDNAKYTTEINSGDICQINKSFSFLSSFVMFLDHTRRRTTVGRTHLDEWSARRRDHTTLTSDKHPCPRRVSNPQSQQANGRRATP